MEDLRERLNTLLRHLIDKRGHLEDKLAEIEEQIYLLEELDRNLNTRKKK